MPKEEDIHHLPERPSIGIWTINGIVFTIDRDICKHLINNSNVLKARIRSFCQNIENPDRNFPLLGRGNGGEGEVYSLGGGYCIKIAPLNDYNKSAKKILQRNREINFLLRTSVPSDIQLISPRDCVGSYVEELFQNRFEIIVPAILGVAKIRRKHKDYVLTLLEEVENVRTLTAIIETGCNAMYKRGLGIKVSAQVEKHFTDTFDHIQKIKFSELTEEIHSGNILVNEKEHILYLIDPSGIG